MKTYALFSSSGLAMATHKAVNLSNPRNTDGGGLYDGYGLTLELEHYGYKHSSQIVEIIGENELLDPANQQYSS